MDIENRTFTAAELEIISTANAEIDEIKERCEMWRNQASEYKKQHQKDTSLIAHLVVSEIKFKGEGCTCVNKPGDEYYCQVHGGEGCWVDLKVKSDLLIEALGDWIVAQSNDVKRSAASAFGGELKTLGETLSKLVDEGADDE